MIVNDGLPVGSERQISHADPVLVEHYEGPCIQVTGHHIEIGQNERRNLGRSTPLLPTQQNHRRTTIVRMGQQVTSPYPPR